MIRLQTLSSRRCCRHSDYIDCRNEYVHHPPYHPKLPGMGWLRLFDQDSICVGSLDLLTLTLAASRIPTDEPPFGTALQHQPLPRDAARPRANTVSSSAHGRRSDRRSPRRRIGSVTPRPYSSTLALDVST